MPARRSKRLSPYSSSIRRITARVACPHRWSSAASTPGQKTDVALRVAATEGMSLRAAAVPDAARVQILPDQARHLRLRLPGHLPQIRPDRALVAPRQRALTELDQRLDDEGVKPKRGRQAQSPPPRCPTGNGEPPQVSDVRGSGESRSSSDDPRSHPAHACVFHFRPREVDVRTLTQSAIRSPQSGAAGPVENAVFRGFRVAAPKRGCGRRRNEFRLPRLSRGIGRLGSGRTRGGRRVGPLLHAGLSPGGELGRPVAPHPARPERMHGHQGPNNQQAKETQDMTDRSLQAVAGIDVGKQWLDVYIDPLDLARRFENTQLGRRALCKWLHGFGVRRAVFEPTGRYHRRLHQCLAAGGCETVLVQPARARRFRPGVREARQDGSRRCGDVGPAGASGWHGGDAANGGEPSATQGPRADPQAIRRRTRRPGEVGLGTRIQGRPAAGAAATALSRYPRCGA